MTSRSRSRLEMEVFATETGADGTEYQVGCACDDHDDDTNWIQCTEANCDIWYCEDNIKETTGASKEDLEKLRESSTLFKCSIHGLQDIHFDAEKENDNNVVSIYNFRKRTKRQSLKEIDDEIDALSNSNSNSHEAKSNKRTKSKKGKPRINKRKKTSSNKNTTRSMMCFHLHNFFCDTKKMIIHTFL